MPLQQFDERIPLWTADNFTHASTPNVWEQTGTSDNTTGRWDYIQIFNSDSIAHNVGLDPLGFFGTTPLGMILVPARAGYDGNPPVDALAATLPAANHYLVSQNINFRGVMILETVGVGQQVTIQYFGGAF